MAREMTPQERAAATRLCIDLLSIIHSDPHPIDEPCGRCLAAIRLYAQETRRAALLEAAQVIPRNWLDPLLKGVRTSSCPEIEQLLQSIKAEIDRLAQEG